MWQRRARPHLELKTRPWFCPVNVLPHQNQHMTKQIDIQDHLKSRQLQRREKVYFLIEEVQNKINFCVQRFDIIIDLYYKHITIVNDDSSIVNK